MKKSMLFNAILALAMLSSMALAQGAVEKLTVKSAVLGEERGILVYVPPGYQNAYQRYPVLYMSDGDAQIGHTAATVQFLARNGRMPQLIIVGITNTDRTRDLTPTRASMYQKNGAENKLPTSGGADNFLKFIETELVPQIESQYRTAPYRIFAGHSFGGLFAMHAFLTGTKLFNSYIAVSPTMHWDNGYLLKKADELFKNHNQIDRTLYFTIANEDGEMLTGFNKFKDLLAARKPKNLEWDSMRMPDEDHGSVVLRSHYQGLRKIFDGWQMTAVQSGGWTPNVADVEAHYAKLSKKFGYQILPPELMVNNLGYRLMGEGKMDEAISLFKTNVERYPQSANVYDSLAEAYEKSGKVDLARSNYEKAVELGQKNNDPNLAIYKTNLERVSGVAKKANNN